MNRTDDPRPLPDNVVAFKIPEERRRVPRWIDRMQAQGLPVQDGTSRLFVSIPPRDAA